MIPNFFLADTEVSEAEENYDHLHTGRAVDFLANVTRQNFTDTGGKEMNAWFQSFGISKALCHFMFWQ